MTVVSSDELRLLAAKIATSYVSANNVPTDQLTGILRVAYHGLQRCLLPVAEAAPGIKKPRRGRPPLVRR